MTQRSNHLQIAPTRPHGTIAALRTGAAPVPILIAPLLAAALILVLVLITGLTSAGYGFA